MGEGEKLPSSKPIYCSSCSTTSFVVLLLLKCSSAKYYLDLVFLFTANDIACLVRRDTLILISGLNISPMVQISSPPPRPRRPRSARGE